MTRGWWQRFCQRHQNVALRTAVPLSVARAMTSNPDVLDRYFKMLTDTLTANRLLHKPTQIYNCSETGMPLGTTHRGVVAGVGSATEPNRRKHLCSIREKKFAHHNNKGDNKEIYELPQTQQIHEGFVSNLEIACHQGDRDSKADIAFSITHC